MSRYIDADKVKEALKQNTPRYMWGEVLATVNIQPYIDLVRCGECKHRISDMCYRELGGDEDLYKRAILFPTMPDDFCSYGEREGE